MASTETTSLLEKGTDGAVAPAWLESSKESSHRDLVIVSMGGFSRKIASGLTGVILAAKLGPGSFGILSIAMSLGIVLVPAGDLGLRTIGWLHATKLGRNVGRSLLQFRLLLGVLVASLAIAFALIAPISQSLRIGISICGMLPLFDSEVVDWWFRAEGRHVLVAVSDFITAVVQIAAVLFLVHGATDIARGAVAWMSGNAAGFVVLAWAYLSGSAGLQISDTLFADVRGALGDVLHLAVPAFLVRFQLFAPVFLIGLMGDSAEIGQFRLAHLIVTMAVSMGVFLTNAMFTRVANANAGSRGAAVACLNEGIRLVNRYMIPVVLLGLSVGPMVMKWWLPSYDAAAHMVRILFLGALLFTHAFYLRQMLPSLGLTRFCNVAYLVPMTIMVGISFSMKLFAGTSGLWAVTTGLFASEAVSYLYCQWLIRRYVGPVYILGKPWRGEMEGWS